MKRLIKANNSNFIKQILNKEVKTNINDYNVKGIVYDFNPDKDIIWVDVAEEGYKDMWTKNLTEVKFVDSYLENLKEEYLENKKGN